jgi:hypothetical protein
VIDGRLLLNHGKGIQDYTAREICNIAYALIREQIQPPMAEDDPSMEEQIIKFETDIGLRAGGESEAYENWRKFMILQGKDPDDPALAEEAARAANKDKEWFEDGSLNGEVTEIAQPKGRRRKLRQLQQEEDSGWQMEW